MQLGSLRFNGIRPQTALLCILLHLTELLAKGLPHPANDLLVAWAAVLDPLGAQGGVGAALYQVARIRWLTGPILVTPILKSIFEPDG